MIKKYLHVKRSQGMHAVFADPQTDLRKQKKLKSEDKIKTTHETFCRKITSMGAIQKS
jgi:hypothetical protein